MQYDEIEVLKELIVRTLFWLSGTYYGLAFVRTKQFLQQTESTTQIIYSVTIQRLTT